MGKSTPLCACLCPRAPSTAAPRAARAPPSLGFNRNPSRDGARVRAFAEAFRWGRFCFWTLFDGERALRFAPLRARPSLGFNLKP